MFADAEWSNTTIGLLHYAQIPPSMIIKLVDRPYKEGSRMFPYYFQIRHHKIAGPTKYWLFHLTSTPQKKTEWRISCKAATCTL